MKTTMKKRLAKGILAATLAFVTVVGIPVGTAKTAKNDSTIVAHAACRQNYRHYETWGSWFTEREYVRNIIIQEGSRLYRYEYQFFDKRRYSYSTCVNCGRQEGIIRSETMSVAGRLYGKYQLYPNPEQ